MKYLVTGGAGFIGSNLVRRLLRSNQISEILIFDNLKSGSINFISDCLKDQRVKFVCDDMHNIQVLDECMKFTHRVYHLAANPDISKAESNPKLDFDQGTILTQNLLECVRLNNVKQIVFTSGSGVYGDVIDQTFSENYGPCMPISPYGAAKLASEALISAYCYMFGIKGVAFRFANVVGPNQTHGVGFDFMNRLRINDKELRILGDGNQKKSYIYISDVLDAIDLVLERNEESKPFDIFNVSTLDYITVTEIALIACKTLNIDPENIIFNYSGGDRGWNGDVPKVQFDSSKIRLLGWSNQFSSKQAIQKSLEKMI